MALGVIPAGQRAADCKPRMTHLRQTETEKKERHVAGYFSSTLLNWMSKQA